MSRIFDHLSGEPEDRVFSRVAWAMRNAPTWTRVTERSEPAPVSGEMLDARPVMAWLEDLVRK